MERPPVNSRGAALVRRLRRGCEAARRALLPGARNLPVLRGLTPTCLFTSPQENVLKEVHQILQQSVRVFRREGSIVLVEGADAANQCLHTLAINGVAERSAAARLANLFVCETTNPSKNGAQQFSPPQKLVDLALNHEPGLAELPEIRVYSKRPLFDDDLIFRGPGWHPDVGFMVHGLDVDPVIPISPRGGESAMDMLPPHTRELLSDFCFRSDADVTNAVAVLITGLLVPRYISPGKPVVLFDGNQPGVGKTLFARVVGVVLDGVEPDPITFTSNDEEMAKRMGAGLRSKHTSVVLLDNAKMREGAGINSAAIEANSVAPNVTFRILGQSQTFSRPNDLLWLVTMNQTRTSPDLASRVLPIQFRFDGSPGARDFGGRDPVAYALRHRAEILGELAGMVLFWNQQGRPPGLKRHRMTQWATEIGGIVEACGLTCFLDNLNVTHEFNQDTDRLAALAEAAVCAAPAMITEIPAREATIAVQQNQPERGLPASELERLFRLAGVLTEKLDTTQSARAKSTQIGQWLTQLIDRHVPIESCGRTGAATLQCECGRSRVKRYYFVVIWDNAMCQTGEEDTTTIPPASPVGRGRERQPSPRDQLSMGPDAEADAEIRNITPTNDQATEQRPDTARQRGNQEDW